MLSLQFADHDESRGFPRGAQWDVMPLGGPLFTLFRYDDRPFDERWGPAIHGLIDRTLGHAFDWGVGIEDLPHEHNTVTLDPVLTDSDGIPAPKIRFEIDADMRANLEWQLERAKEAHEAAGAVDTIVADWSHWGWHLLGTARMGDDPATSVVDRYGQAHDVPNLYVMDGSVVRHLGPDGADVDDLRERAALHRQAHRAGESPARAGVGAGSHPLRPRPGDVVAGRCRVSGRIRDPVMPNRFGIS